MNWSKGMRRIVVLMLIFFCVQTVSLYSEKKQLEVVTDEASIYLEPTAKSFVIETLQKGAVLTLASVRKFRRCWNYIYFTSEKSGCMKSGYVLDSTIKKLYKDVKVRTIYTEN